MHRYANFVVHPTYPQFLVSILEDHTEDTPPTVVNTLCVINTHTKTVSPLVSGADFYASPAFSPDGAHIAWQQWYHPDMPWSGAEIHVADVVVGAEGITLKNDIHVAGEKVKISAAYPSWATNDTLLFTSDKSGYQNPWKYIVGKGASPIYTEPLQEDCGTPAWTLGRSPYAVVGATREWAIFVHMKDGRSVLYLVDIHAGSKHHIDSPYIEVDAIRTLSAEHNKIVFLGGKVDAKSAITQCSISDPAGLVPTFEFTTLKVVASGASSKFSKDLVSIPQPLTLKVPPHDESLHIVFYPPHNPEYSGSSIEGEKPPCVVNSHGGPTSMNEQGLNWTIQYFTSRGWGW